MLSSQQPFSDLEGTYKHLLRLCILALVIIELGQIAEVLCYLKMLRSICFLINVKHAPEHLLGLWVLPLLTIEVGQVIEAGCGVGMLGPQSLLTDSQGTQVQ